MVKIVYVGDRINIMYDEIKTRGRISGFSQNYKKTDILEIKSADISEIVFLRNPYYMGVNLYPAAGLAY
jgi:hypothetical protein